MRNNIPHVLPRNTFFVFLTCTLLLITNLAHTQTFPAPSDLSTGQGAVGTADPIWTVSQNWYGSLPVPNPMTINYTTALINYNCAPGAWVNSSSLPAPVNNGNWITGGEADCANNSAAGYRFFRLQLNLPADCNGYSVTTPGAYTISFSGYVDNSIANVYINGNPQGISGGSYSAGSQLNFTLNGPWVVGVNYIDVLVYNTPNGGAPNPYGLLLVANPNSPTDTDGDGVPNISDLCPCTPGNNSFGCVDPANPNACNLNAIRTAFTNAGCQEMVNCSDACSMYFLNHQSMTGVQAQAFAQTLGANLVSVESQAENNCILSSLNAMGENGIVWIGLSDAITEGNFVWYDQSPVTYTNWAPGEPNNAGDEDCVQIYANGLWNDLPCNIGNSKSIIEVNLCPVVNAGADVTICRNQTANLQASNSLFGSSPYTYHWNNGPNVQANPVAPTSTTTYTVTTTDRYSCTSSDAVVVNVNQLPNITTAAPAEYCAGTSVTLPAPTSSVSGTSYTWTNNNTAIGLAANGIGTVPTFIATNTGTANISATITVTPTANGCTGPTNTYVVTIKPVPTVTTVPAQNVCNTQSSNAITLASTVPGTSFTWTNSNTAIGLGANGNTTIPSFTGTNAGTVSIQGVVTVTPTANGCTGPTSAINFTVNPTPNVATIAPQTWCAGVTTTAINPTGAVAGTSFNWTNSNTNIGLAANGNGTIPAFTATNTTNNPIVGNVSVTPSANGCVGTAGNVNITVNPSPIVNPIANQSVCRGANSALVVPSSNVTGATFTWTNSNSNIGLASSGNGNIPSFPTTNTTNSPISGTITVTPTANGCVGTASTFTITVNPQPIATQITTQTFCPGFPTPVINFASTVGGTIYSWTSSNAAIGLPTSGTGDIPSFTPTNATTASISSTITVTPSVSGCNGSTMSFFIIVNPTPSANPINNQTVCNGASTTAVPPNGPITGTSFTWSNTHPSIGLAASGNGTIPAFVATNNGDTNIVATISVTPAANGCNGTPRTFTITVRPTPTVNSVINQTVCNGTNTAAVNFSSPVAGTTYSWTSSNGTIGLLPSGNGNIPSFTAVNNGNVPVTTTISVTPTANSCTGPVRTFTITVSPAPTITPVANQTVCNGANTSNIPFTSNITGTTFAWTNNNTASGLAASGTGDIAPFTATNTGTSSITSSITVTPSSNTCNGGSLTFDIVVNPTPAVNTVNNQTVCNGLSTNTITFSSATPGTTYAWTNNNTATGLGTNGSGDIAAFTATNAGTVPITSTVTVTPTANGCVGTPIIFDIIVNPTPTVNTVTDQAICTGASTADVIFASPVNGATFDWTNNETSIGLAASGNGNILAFPTTNTGLNPVTATITVTPTANGCVGTPTTFTITVNPNTTVNTVTNQTVCNGANTADVNFVSPITGATFDWTNDTPGIGLPATGTGDIAAFPAVNTGTTPVMATISITPSANSCNGVQSSFTIMVNPTPTVDNINDLTVCNGAATTTVDINGSLAGTTFDWTNNNTNTGLAASGTDDIASFTATNTGNTAITSLVTVTPTLNGCTGSATTFDIMVNPSPNVDAVNDQAVCNTANTADIIFASNVAGTSFTWTNDNTNIGLAASGTGDIYAFPATNTGTAPITATITVSGTANACTGPNTSFTITINPTPTVDNIADQTLCGGAASTAVTFASPVNGSTFAWANDNTAIGLAASGNGNNFASFTGANTTNADIMGIVTVTPTADGCVGTANTFNITVHPIPDVASVNDQTLCNGTNTTAISFTSGVNNTSFAWSNTNISTGLAASGTGDIATFPATNGSTAPITSTVTVTPSANNCTGTATDFNIVVNPTHTGTPVDAQICDGDTYTFGGQNFTTSGTHPVVFQNVYGCDSTVNLNLTVIPAMGPPPTNTFFNTGTNGTGGTLPGGSPDANWTVSTTGLNGTYNPATVMTAIPGNYYSSPWPDCEWISHNATGNHTGNQDFFYKIEFDLACANQCGQSYLDPNVFCLNLDFFADNSVFEIYLNGAPQSGILGNMPVTNPYTATGFNSAGMVSVSFCDGWQAGTNTLIVQVASGSPYAGFLGQTSVNPPPPMSDTVTASICDNETYSFGTQTLTTAGTFTETFTSVLGCDSVMTVVLTVNPTFIENLDVTICDGDIYTFDGQDYTTAGSYPILFQTVNGCDSTVTLNLTVNPSYNTSFQESICEGASITFAGNTYNTTGNYPFIFQTVNGCDSTVTLELTVTPNPAVTINPQPDQCFNGNSFNFSLSQPGGANANYNWTFTGANSTSSTLAAPQNITYPSVGQYTVDVSVEENSCQSQGSLVINVLAQPNAQLNALPPTGCAPLSVDFTNITTGGGDVQWTFSGGTPATSTSSTVSVVYNTPGQYAVSLTVTLANGCSDTETVPALINVQAQPVAGFTIQPLEVDMTSPTATFIDGSVGASNIYYYVEGEGGVSGPDGKYNFNEEGTYTVMQVVTSSGGCADTAYGQLVVIGATEIFIPNAFTPNTDPMNPEFGVYGNGFTEFHMWIFNRWGELIFESVNPDHKWDGNYGGKPAKSDVYVYKVQLRDYKKSLKTYTGSVILIR